jgi:hypothetical protein
MVGNAAPLSAGESINIAGSREAICEDIDRFLNDEPLSMAQAVAS